MKGKSRLLAVGLVFSAAGLALSQWQEKEQMQWNTTSGEMEMSWQGKVGRTYFIKFCPDLKTQNWSYLPEILTGDGSEITYSFDIEGTDTLFFQLEFSDIPTSDPANADFDGDGVSNNDEIFFNISPTNSDTDGDGISDGGEIDQNTDPNDEEDTPEVEWLRLTGDLDEGVKKTKERTLELLPGKAYLVLLVISSAEYPDWTGKGSEFNDLLEWEITSPAGETISGSLDVNSRHSQWQDPGDYAHDFGLIEEVGIFHNEDTSVVEIKLCAKVTNIGDGILPSKVDIGLLPVEIEKVWSDQFPNRENVNFFTKTATSTGERPYILMGERADGTAYVRVKMNPAINVDGIRNKVLVALADSSVEPRSPVGQSTVIDSNNEVSVTLDNPSADEYVVVAGYDSNGDGTLQGSEIVVETENFIRIVTNLSYEAEKLILEGLSVAPGAGGDFLDAFLDDASIQGASLVQIESLPTNAPSLAHNVGLLFGTDSKGDMRKHTFNDGTDVETDVANSDGMQRIIEVNMLPPLVLEVNNHFDANPDDVEEVFNSSFNDILAYQLTEDPTLFPAFGRVNLSINIAVTVRGSDRKVTQVVLSGVQEDLYDYDYEINEGAARVQSGYNTLGDAGRIFRSIVNINEAITSIDYTY